MLRDDGHCVRNRNKKVHEKGKNNLFHELGGPNRDRTDDLTDANRTLSQLSYGPLY